MDREYLKGVPILNQLPAYKVQRIAIEALMIDKRLKQGSIVVLTEELRRICLPTFSLSDADLLLVLEYSRVSVGADERDVRSLDNVLYTDLDEEGRDVEMTKEETHYGLGYLDQFKVIIPYSVIEISEEKKSIPTYNEDDTKDGVVEDLCFKGPTQIWLIDGLHNYRDKSAVYWRVRVINIPLSSEVVLTDKDARAYVNLVEGDEDEVVDIV